jgi:hypothetical protein
MGPRRITPLALVALLALPGISSIACGSEDTSGSSPGNDAGPDGSGGGGTGGMGGDAGKPPGCGNDQLDPGEACDGAQLGGLTCATLRVGSTGALACAPGCVGFDLTGCSDAGAEVTASSCESNDVQAAIDSAKDGDTVSIPAGACTWNQQVATPGDKSLRLRGAGSKTTVITAGVDQAMSLGAVEGKAVELSDIGFVGTTGSNGIVSVGGGTKSFRVHDVDFVSNGQNRAIHTWGDTFGVIDHCTTSGPIIEFVTVDGANWPSWQPPRALGTADAVYVEDNTITWSSGYEGAPVFDSERGGRLVFRHNQVTNSIAGNHGFDTGGVASALSFEVYANTFTIDTGFNSSGGTLAFAGLIRGGTGVWYDNTWEVDSSIWAHDAINLSIFRIALMGTSEESHLSWPTCDGTELRLCSTLDQSWKPASGVDAPTACAQDSDCPGGSTCKWKLCSVSRMTLCAQDSDCPSGEACSSFLDGPDGYPCFQQPGFGPGMQPAPLYEWNNVMNGAQFGAGHDVDFGPAQDQIAEGRDFFNDTPAPGYVAYPYPHVLVTATK